MTVRLRAHHLLCMLTYVGKGYSEAFVANYDRIIARLGDGEDILLVAGPDDVCKPLLGTRLEHCHRVSVIQRDAQAAEALGMLLGQSVRPGSAFRLDAGLIDRMRQAFAAGLTRAACKRCEWHELCTDVAGRDYPDVRLAARPPQSP